MGRKAGILVSVYVAVLAINLDVTIVNVALPQHCGRTPRRHPLDCNSYNLAFSALVPAAGSLSDRHGRRPALLVGILGFAATSAVGAMVDSTGAAKLERFGHAL
ncbi:hypothetical protein ACQPZ2_22460 [Nocardia pseudovaccinii]|uniref:hypothetical protein n=1 Tax=Nocardia pseudovaccinii TaxID=189540 RepID=UPI003D8E93DA